MEIKPYQISLFHSFFISRAGWEMPNHKSLTQPAESHQTQRSEGLHPVCKINGTRDVPLGPSNLQNRVGADFVTFILQALQAPVLHCHQPCLCHLTKVQPVPVPLPRCQTLLDRLLDGSKLKEDLQVKALSGLLEVIPGSCLSPG